MIYHAYTVDGPTSSRIAVDQDHKLIYKEFRHILASDIPSIGVVLCIGNTTATDFKTACENVRDGRWGRNRVYKVDSEQFEEQYLRMGILVTVTKLLGFDTTNDLNKLAKLDNETLIKVRNALSSGS